MARNLEAARSGDQRRALEVLRDSLAAALDDASAQVHAQLAAQYRAVLADLAALPPRDGLTARERLNARVATVARLSDAND